MDFDTDYFEYQIPEEILAKFTDEFLDIFTDGLIQVFWPEDGCLDLSALAFLTGTNGWCKAFKAACKVFNIDDVFEYYESLEWYDSDIFDDELCSLLVRRRRRRIEV